MPTRAPLAALALLAAACSGGPPAPARGASTGGASARIERTAEWLYATRDQGGGADECAVVLDWVRGEAACRGALCVHASRLAGEWVARCSDASREDVAEVEKLQARWSKDAREPASACARTAEEIVRDGCGDADRSCRKTSLRWTSRCQEEGSPLVLRVLERNVERRSGEPGRVSLDRSDCPALAEQVLAGGRCELPVECEKAADAVAAYRKRCEGSDELPSLEWAVRAVAAQAAADRGTPEPMRAAAEPAKLEASDELGVVLQDRSGVIVSACGARVVDLGGWLAARQSCQGGTVVVVRAFSAGGRERVVRAGELPFDDDATFSRHYPSIVAYGEADARGSADAAAFRDELDAVAKLAKNALRAPEAARALARLVVPRAGAIARSPDLQAVLAAHDDSLSMALRELGRMKLSAVRGKLPAIDALAIAKRAPTRVFADLAADGSIAAGAPTRALDLDVSRLLPRGTAMYRASLAGLANAIFLKRASAESLKSALAGAREAATRCGEAQKRLDESERALAACAFGKSDCAEGRAAELAQAIDDARAAADEARQRLVAASTGSLASWGNDLAERAAKAGCLDPWW